MALCLYHLASDEQIDSRLFFVFSPPYEILNLVSTQIATPNTLVGDALSLHRRASSMSVGDTRIG